MSLRLRLTLVIVAVVAVMGMVSLVSFRLNRSIESMVADLARTSTTPIEAEPLMGQTLSIEGRWEEPGRFVASEIERLPRSRRPQIRGAVQAVDRAGRSLTLNGLTVSLTDDTALDTTPAPADPLDLLAPGTRVEVSCKAGSDGRWVARKIDLQGVKSSDKIKGRITRVDLSGTPLRTLEVEGFAVGVPRGVEVSYPQGPFYRMQIASSMSLSVQEALAAAQELLKLRYREREQRTLASGEATEDLGGALRDAEDRLGDAAESFAHYISESLQVTEARIRAARAAGAAERAAAEQERIDRWLQPLERQREVLASQVDELSRLAGRDPDAAQAFLREEFEPAVRQQLVPRVRAYLGSTETELDGELEAIAARADEAAHNVLLANIAGVLLALTSGLLLSRSISVPIRGLRDAARAIGRGELGTVVEVRSRDELGDLAEAFNRMAAELAATTVSVARLDNVIDSMAGALLIVDERGCVASVNPAALELLGYTQEEILGRPLDTICPGADREARGERALVCKNGTRLPVFFSSASLRREDGAGGGFVCVALDLSDRKRIEEELRRSLAEKELLLREVHHRVKNNLQVISSLLDLQSRLITDPESLAHFQASQDRIRSMVFIHDQLHRTENLESIDLRSYLEQLVAHLAQSHVDPPGRVTLRTQLEGLRIDLDRALACGLIVNELVTNALEHAFEQGAPGEIVVACRAMADGWMALEVSDNGRDFSVEAVDQSGATLGLSLVRTQANQLGGRLVSEPGKGASIRVEFPSGSGGRTV